MRDSSIFNAARLLGPSLAGVLIATVGEGMCFLLDGLSSTAVIASFYTMAFLGMAPFGGLFAGGLASQIGAPHTILLGGVFCILGSILFVRKLPSLREIVARST